MTIEITNSEDIDFDADARVEIARPVQPKPKLPGPSHWWQHPTEKWWTCGNNAGQLWICPLGDKGDEVTLEYGKVSSNIVHVESVGPEERCDGWFWVAVYVAITKPG